MNWYTYFIIIYLIIGLMLSFDEINFKGKNIKVKLMFLITLTILWLPLKIWSYTTN